MCSGGESLQMCGSPFYGVFCEKFIFVKRRDTLSYFAIYAYLCALIFEMIEICDKR